MFLPMPVTQRAQPQLLRSLNTPLALLKGYLQVQDFEAQHDNRKAGTSERADGREYGEEPGRRVKAVAHYFRERVDGQYDGTVMDL